MFATPAPGLRIAIYGSEVNTPGRGVGLWAAGYRGAVAAAGAEPLFLEPNQGDDSWDELLAGCIGVVVCGFEGADREQGDLESLCLWARSNAFPILAIDEGLLAMNAAFGGLNHQNLPKELPEALQHRHPPEPGLRHAIVVEDGTRLAKVYGEGEIVVNSEHRQAIQRPAKGFLVSAKALDGVTEAIEFQGDSWFAVGVQWQPASATASGLDIQVFRALIDAAQGAQPASAPTGRKGRSMAAAA